MKNTMLLTIAAMFVAFMPSMADSLAITPIEIPVATQQVYYALAFTATGGSGNYNWSVVPWTCETAEPSN